MQENQQLAALIVLTKTKKVNIDNILEWCAAEMKEEEVPTIFKLVMMIIMMMIMMMIMILMIMMIMMMIMIMMIMMTR